MSLHDCAQVERDCMDLHRALAEACRRLSLLSAPRADLMEVLDRTARTETPAARLAARERRVCAKGFMVG